MRVGFDLRREIDLRQSVFIKLDQVASTGDGFGDVFGCVIGFIDQRF